MNQEGSDKVLFPDFDQQYTLDFIAGQRKAGMLKDDFPDEQALNLFENADHVIVALKGNRVVGGFMLYCRSPNEVMWTDLFCVPTIRKDRFEILFGIWNRLGDVMMNNRISWVIARPRDKRLMRFFKLLGFMPLSEKILGIPLGIFHPIFQRSSEKSLFRFFSLSTKDKLVVKDGFLQFFGIFISIRIDLKSGLTQYVSNKKPDQWHDYERRCGRVYYLNREDYTQHLHRGSPTDIVFIPELGHMVFPEIDVILRSPWWSKAPSEVITTPAHDNDPFRMNRQGDHIHVLNWDAYDAGKMGPHQLRIEQDKDRYTFVFSNLSEYKYLRLYFEYKEKPRSKDNEFVFGDLKFLFQPNFYAMKGYKSIDNFNYRLYLFFKEKEVKFTIEKIER
jgi:hypothetical protein